MLEVTEVDYGNFTVRARINGKWNAFYDGSNLFIEDDNGEDVQLDKDTINQIADTLWEALVDDFSEDIR